jgi:hypothetical protein
LTGDLSKLNHLREREDIRAIKLFTNIHGIGPTSAQSFVSQVKKNSRNKFYLTFSFIYLPEIAGISYFRRFENQGKVDVSTTSGFEILQRVHSTNSARRGGSDRKNCKKFQLEFGNLMT